LKSLSAERFPQLRSLLIDQASLVCNSLIERLAEPFTYLEKLHLNVGYDENVQRVLCQTISKLGNQMRSLILGDADDVVVSAIASQRTLQFLNLSFMRTRSSSDRIALVEPLRSLKNVKGLRFSGFMNNAALEAVLMNNDIVELELVKVYGITDGALVASSHRLSLLTKLRLEHLKNVSDASLSSISEQCKLISHLSLAFVDQISDSGIIALVEANPNLRSIYFDSCMITDCAVVALAYNCRNLEKATIYRCRHVKSIESILMLIQMSKLRSMRDLWIDNCGPGLEIRVINGQEYHSNAGSRPFIKRAFDKKYR
jgi:hypothetical protein